jgi:hypothetical protein
MGAVVKELRSSTQSLNKLIYLRRETASIKRVPVNEEAPPHHLGNGGLGIRISIEGSFYAFPLLLLLLPQYTAGTVTSKVLVRVRCLVRRNVREPHVRLLVGLEGREKRVNIAFH